MDITNKHKDIISKFIEDSKDLMNEQNLTKDDVCFIIIVDGQPSSVFKTLDDFENKVEYAVNDIDDMFDVDFILWIFD